MTDVRDFEAAESAKRSLGARSSIASMERSMSKVFHSGDPKFGAWGMTVTQFSFQISGAVVALPFAYAALGWAFALIIQFAWLGCNFLVAKLVSDVVRGKEGEERKVKCLADVGDTLYGRPGRLIASSMQVAFMMAVLLIELDLAAQTLQYLAGYPWDCLGYWSLICWGFFMIVLLFVRRFKENLWFSSTNALVGSIKGLILLPIAYAVYKADIQASPAYVGPTKAFFSSRSWSELSQAMSLIVLASQPVFIQAEITEDIVDSQKHRALLATNAAIVLYGVLYLTAGLTGSLILGYGATTAPITTALPRTGLTLAINALLMISTVADFLIGSLILNTWVRDILNLKPPKPFYYVMGMLPSGLLALLIVLCVPDFTVLASILTAFCACGQESFLTTLSWWLGDWKRTNSSPAWLCVLYKGTTIVGAALTAYLVAGSIEGFISAYITSDSIPTFFCQSVN